jgi:hypothetical protein
MHGYHAVADQKNPSEMVTIMGKVIEQIAEGATDHANRPAKKHLGLDKYLTIPQTNREFF